MRNALREILAIAAGLVVAIVAFAAGQVALLPLMVGRLPRDIGTIIFVLVSVGIPAAVALFAWRWTRSRLGNDGPLIRSRIVRWIVVASYLLTWALGVPAVHTSLVTFEISEYKRMRTENNRVWEAHPRIEFSFDIPILPFVILSFHEYQLAGLYGWGGWDLHFWSGMAVTRIGRVALWVS
jgi:hypothetical protein